MNKQEVFEFLDNLRESGQINMLGAVPYIREVFGVDRIEARALLVSWISYREHFHRTMELLTNEQKSV